MTAADKLRELLATRPPMPNVEELTRWWRAGAKLVVGALDELAAMKNARDQLAEIAEANHHVLSNGLCSRCSSAIDPGDLAAVDELRAVNAKDGPW